jgi:hypothetical protein
LKAVEPQVGQRHEYVEMKWKYYHITIFPERTWNFTSRRGQVKTIEMEHFNDNLFHKSGPANKQHTIARYNSFLPLESTHITEVCIIL